MYAVAVASSSVSYNNSTSGLTSTNVQGAIDELYEKTEILNTKVNKSKYAYCYAKTDDKYSFSSNCLITRNSCVNSLKKYDSNIASYIEDYGSVLIYCATARVDSSTPCTSDTGWKIFKECVGNY